MTELVLTCSAPGCNAGAEAPFKTPKMASSDAMMLLKMHREDCHPPAAAQAGQAREVRPQAERVKRPTLTLSGQSIDQEEYDHFHYLFGQYKERLGDNGDSPAKLQECLAPDVSKMLYSSLGAEIKNLDEEGIFRNIVACCVTKQTVQARTTELHRIRQEPGQPVQSFLAALKSKARQCEMKMICTNQTCRTEINYSDPVILGLFINGVGDTELQQDLLAEQDMTLVKAVAQAVARETAKRSQGVLDTNQQAVNAVSTYKRDLKKVDVPPDCCGCCGNKRHSDRKDCPAKDNLCSCGIKGHFRKYCYRDGKKRNPQSGGGKKSTKEEKEIKEETSHGIGESCFNLSESCFNLQAEGETSRGSGTNHGSLLSPPPMPTINLPEDVILASLQYSEGNDRWVHRAKDENSNKLHVLIKPMLEQWDKLHNDPSCTPTKSKMKKTQSAGIADTGASVLCSGTNLMRQLGMEEKNLCQTTTVIRAANEAKLDVLGFIPVSVQVVGHQNKKSVQALYITKQLKSLFLSRACLLELGCLPRSWPYPAQEAETCAPVTEENLAQCGCPIRSETPPAPTKPPFPVTDTEECRERLQEWLLSHYKSSTFNTCPHQILPGMTGPELKLAIKPGAIPTCHTIPHRCPLHWKEQVLEGIKRDIKMGIIEELPANTPAKWCHKMVITSKPGSTKPRRTVDMSALKTASYRLTHPGAPPFLEAQSVPADSYKTVTDAWQGFHMIPLHEDSREFTTFLTEWGMFRYKRMPMGDHVSMDAYNYRFDKVTAEVKNKKRCVDDSLLYSETLEKSFMQAASYLSLMGNNGIIQCPEKFQFGNKTVAWAGFTIGPDSVKPLPKHTEAVRTYPTPVNITDMRSFMALLQQVAYCYAISPVVAKLRHLLKPSEPWNWTEDIDNAFVEAKRVIAEKVEEGVKLYDPKLHTGLLTDWCQEGIGHILCQKHCDCPLTKEPPGEKPPPADLNCCKTGWKVCSVGSRFCNTAEANYSPTDGEFTGLVDALEKTAYFTLGCKSLTVGTDHQPLIPIINGTDMEKVKTPRQIRLKEKLLRWDLRVVYIPGKFLGGTDALSRYGVRDNNDEKVNWMTAITMNMAEVDSIAPWSDDTLCSLTGSQPPVTEKDILSTTSTDKVLTTLLTKIEQGFPETKAELEQEVQPYWRVKDMLSAYKGIIYMGDRVVVPAELRDRALDTLHAAHQGTTSMRLRAERNMFWPNMARDIATKRMSCLTCDETAPSQSPEPPMTPIHPEYPFQHICSDFFSLQGHNFCLVVDRFSNWLQIFTGKGGAHNLISLLGQCFHSFGIPETLTSDGGPEYTAGNTQEFLRKLGVHHRLTSVGFPHANQKAEKSVGSAKRVIRDSVKPNGELDPIPLVKGLLTLRNTPDQDTGMSPAQMLLGRDLRDFLPGSKPKKHMTSNKDMRETWQEVADWRELALAPRGAKLHDRLKQGTKELPPLEIGDHVMLQNQLGNKPKRWDKRGVVVQADPKTRQYKVMAFGSRRLTLRNRRFLRKYTPINIPPGTPTGLSLGMRLGGQNPVQSTEGGTSRGSSSSPGSLLSQPAPVFPPPVSAQPTACTQYSLPPVPEPVQHTVISQQGVQAEHSLPQVQQPAQHAGYEWGATQTVPVQPTYIQPPVQHQMFQAQPVAPQMHNFTMSPPVGNFTMSPPVGNITMSPPAGTRVSMRSSKGQTTKYDDFVQQITLKPGTYASDGNNLYMLEDVGNKGNMLNMLTALPTWQQKIDQNWSPDTAYVQQLACDSHHQCQQYNMMTNNMRNGNMMTNNMMYGNMMTGNMLNGNMMNNNSGYLANEGYSCYQDYSP